MRKMEKIVCVTGASGYIASWLVKLLLQRDYTVKATVRNLGDSNKVGHLKALEGAKERLQLFEANLIEEGSFDSIIDGCQGVFHTASPVLVSVTDPQTELMEPIVKGTLNVLKSCSRASCVRRVVVTSSIASVMINQNPRGPDTVVDETWFSDPELCKQSELWYWQAKTLAEEAAVKFAKENGIELVVMNPGFVIGPLLQPSLNTTSDLFLDLIKGKKVISEYHFVDVRDVAYAHIMAFENPSANGRYILVESSITHYQALQILNNLYPLLNIPNKNDRGNSTFQVSKKRAESLGLTFIPLEESFKDTVQSLKDKNFLHFLNATLSKSMSSHQSYN